MSQRGVFLLKVGHLPIAASWLALIPTVTTSTGVIEFHYAGNVSEYI